MGQGVAGDGCGVMGLLVMGVVSWGKALMEATIKLVPAVGMARVRSTHLDQLACNPS